MDHPGVTRGLDYFTLKPQYQHAGKSLRLSIDNNNRILANAFSRVMEKSTEEQQRLLGNNVTLGNPKSTNRKDGTQSKHVPTSSKKKKNQKYKDFHQKEGKTTKSFTQSSKTL